MTERKTTEVLNDTDLDDVQGGIAMLLPAVQQAREAPRKSTNDSQIKSGSTTFTQEG